MMGKVEALIRMLSDRGYKEYRSWDDRTRLFQRRMRDAVGTKYFIDAHLLEIKHHKGLQFEVQCETPSGAVQLETVQWFNDLEHLEKIEAAENLVERFWQFCGSPYYEKLEDA
jgi:hypothetical protein